MYAQHIENEAAYEDAIRNRIRANARKGKGKRWLAEDPTRAALVTEIRQHVGIDYPAEVQAIYDAYTAAGFDSPLEEDMHPDEAQVIRKYRRDFGKRYVNPFIAKMWDALEEWGSLTEGQERAVRASLAKAAEGDKVREARKAEQAAERATRDAGSVHIGTVGQREVFTLTFEGVHSFEGMYGTTYIHRFKDEARNVVVYLGSKLLDCERGSTVTIKATVKEHGQYQGINQTKLSRPVLVA